MSDKTALVAAELSSLTQLGEPIEVSLSNELVHLLSDQLYQSPLKAIEELVVNAFDADATECRIYVPTPDDEAHNYIIVFDDGIGMDRDGLTDLWQIGRSNKRTEEIEKRRKRKQIGKFGIGKIATYTIARKLTYITKSNKQILSVTIDFNDFLESPKGAGKPIQVPVRRIDNWDAFVRKTNLLLEILDAACIDHAQFLRKGTWTVALLEDLKREKTKKIVPGRLQWTLRTAMPLRDDFRLYLNCDEVISSKEAYEKVVEFDLNQLPKNRLDSIKESTGEAFRVDGRYLKSKSFKAGISGTVVVTKKTLLGKSDDIERSHGFFIKVRDRLVNESEPLFGLTPLFHGTFNRFRADIQADDLDDTIKASRETVEETKLKETFRALLREVFNEANKRYADYQQEQDQQDKAKREGDKTVVAPRLVEYPIADALLVQSADSKGTEADEGWFYLEVDKTADLTALAQMLYTVPRSKYRYEYTARGESSRLVKFNPATSTFWINADHDLVKEYADQGQARILLEDFVTAEALLEIYLRESRIPPHQVGEILERHDALLRSLARDHTYSLDAISKSLRDSMADEHDLEVALVVAARALGFVATHIAGAGEPDGIARFTDYPNGEKKITLEAKSSEEVPSLGAIDFAGLQEHVKRNEADGCLLVAPAYPGKNRQEDSAAAVRAQGLKISCWTVEQLARFISVAESRQLTSRHMLDIVLNYYSPKDVSEAIDKLLGEPQWDSRALYKAILKALRRLAGRLKDRQRTIDMIATEVSDEPEFSSVGVNHIETAIRDLASASQGAMTLRDKTIVIHTSFDELERRLEGLTKDSGEPRKRSNFREL